MRRARTGRRLDPTLKRFLAAVGPAVLSGLLLTLAFPPLSLWPVAWLALAPLYVTGMPAGKPWGGFLRGFVFALALFLLGMFWMTEIGGVPWFILSIIEATPFGLMLMAGVLLLPRLPAWARPIVFAALWTLFEWLRSYGKYAFPWFLLSSSQVRALPLLQVVSLTGQWGLSFAIALVGGLWGETWQARRQAQPRQAGIFAASAVGVMAVLAVGGLVAENIAGRDPAETRTISLAQGAIPKQVEMSGSFREQSMQVYSGLTTAAAGAVEKPDVIVWPETVVPGNLLHEPDLFAAISALARTRRTPLLTGTVDIDANDRYTNSAFLFDGGGNMTARYDKVQLVPLGEFFPLRDVLGAFYTQYNVPRLDMSPGELPGTVVIAAPGGDFRLGLMICYDDVFVTQSRDRALHGAGVITLMTSDETFGTTSGVAQHVDLDVVRAVETRRWVARAGAAGPSEFISPTGRIEAVLPLLARGVLSRRVPLRHDLTLFVLWGDWWVAVCALIVLATVVNALAARKAAP